MKYWLIKTTEVDQHTQRPTTPGAINGGMGKRSDAGDIKQAYFTVEVEDIEATLAKVTKAGGQVIREKIDMGQTGQMAVFADFDGNIIGLYHR